MLTDLKTNQHYATNKLHVEHIYDGTEHVSGVR